MGFWQRGRWLTGRYVPHYHPLPYPIPLRNSPGISSAFLSYSFALIYALFLGFDAFLGTSCDDSLVGVPERRTRR
jgi:hypothetical protein